MIKKLTTADFVKEISKSNNENLLDELKKYKVQLEKFIEFNERYLKENNVKEKDIWYFKGQNIVLKNTIYNLGEMIKKYE